MKIVHIVEAFSTGIFDFIVDLSNNLPECEFIIIHGKRPETTADFECYFSDKTQFIHWKNITRELCLGKDFLALKELFAILSVIKGIDVIHLHSSKAGFLGRIVTRFLGYQDKVIYTAHGVSFLRQDVSFFKSRLFILLEQVGAKLSGKVVACSKSEAEEFAKVGIRAGFVNNGVSKDKQNHKLTLQKAITIATVGRISLQKNPELFNEIATYFLPMKNVRFMWIGEGELSEILSAENISITGWLSKSEVLGFINTIDIYLSTSLWEGLPISVLQAMSAKKPVVLSQCTGNKDLVRDNGFLFNNRDEAIHALELLLADAEKRYQLGEKSAQLWQESFSIEQMVAGYWQYYQSCKG